MKFFDYLESKYVEKNILIQEEFNLFIQAETHATQNLINAQRCFFRWICYPKIIIEFILVSLKLKSGPITIKERHDAAKAKANVVPEAQG